MAVLGTIPGVELLDRAELAEGGTQVVIGAAIEPAAMLVEGRERWFVAPDADLDHAGRADHAPDLDECRLELLVREVHQGAHRPDGVDAGGLEREVRCARDPRVEPAITADLDALGGEVHPHVSRVTTSEHLAVPASAAANLQDRVGLGEPVRERLQALGPLGPERALGPPRHLAGVVGEQLSRDPLVLTEGVIFGILLVHPVRVTTDAMIGQGRRMRYVVIGAGAIGAGVGGLLADAGADVLLVARGDHLAAMREGGLVVRTPDGVITCRPEVAGAPEEVVLRTDDVLVLTTKTHQAAAALAAWADAPVHEGAEVIGTAGQRLPLLTALNGVAAEEIALRWFARVYGVCVWMPAVLAQPGEVVVRSTPLRAILHAARYPASLADDGDATFLSSLASDWARAGIRVPTPDDVMPWKYRKLLGNLGNAVQAVLGEGREGEDITEAARVEAREIYAAAGIETNSEESERESRGQLRAAPVQGAPEKMGGSTWQSLQRGTGSAETDFLNGEIVAIAHRLGRTAPVNGALAALVRAAASNGVKPGGMTADELRQAVPIG